MLHELAVACLFLTRLPVRVRRPVALRDLAGCVHLFPLVGALVGAAGGLAFTAASLAGLPSAPAVVLAMAATALLTGALHEDGLAASACRLAGRRREHAGTVALVLVLTGRLIALSSFWDPLRFTLLLVSAAAFSRALMPVLLLCQGEEDSRAAARPDMSRVALALIGGLVFPVVLLPAAPALTAVLTASAVALLAGFWLQRRLGVSGDTLGALQQLAELGFLLALVARW